MMLGKIAVVKVEYHVNENPLTNSEKNGICWLKVNVSNNQKKKYLTILVFKKSAIKCLGFFTLKRVVLNRKYIAKITNPITKPQFLTIIKMTYTGIK